MDSGDQQDRFRLEPETVDVWVYDLGGVSPALFESLSEEERQRAARFRFPEDQHRSAASRALLRSVAAGYLQTDPVALTFATGEQGKPRLEGWPLQINLSHSGRVVAIAVASGEVGVDVEPLDREVRVEELMARVFNERERGWLMQSAAEERKERFFRLWTLKEAAIKGDGRGMWVALSRVSVDVGTLDQPRVVCRVEDQSWSEREIVVPGHRLAVAGRRPFELRLFDRR